MTYKLCAIGNKTLPFKASDRHISHLLLLYSKLYRGREKKSLLMTIIPLSYHTKRFFLSLSGIAEHLGSPRYIVSNR